MLISDAQILCMFTLTFPLCNEAHVSFDNAATVSRIQNVIYGLMVDPFEPTR